MKKNSITITFLSKVSFASLNGADKEIDNINPIKKITMANGEELPYVSSQAIRRALRDKLMEMDWPLSPLSGSSTDKGAPKTEGKPAEFIDDDLFGYMDAQKGKDGELGTSNTRTAPLRVESLLALSSYKGDLDFGTNYMGKGLKDAKGKDIQPNIFETEVHSGLYRGTILIELDRVGTEKMYDKNTNKLEIIKFVEDDERCKRVLGFIDAFRNLWSSGRQSRFLADISPKFIAAAYMKTKNPVFLEAVNVDANNVVEIEKLNTVVNDYDKYIESYVFAGQEAIVGKMGDVQNLKDGFEMIESWIKDYYGQ